MTQKTHDLAIKRGEYTDRNGETKGRWQNVGAAMKNDRGQTFLLLDRAFNPAGIPNPDGYDSVAISAFPVDNQGGGGQQQSGQGGAPTGDPGPQDDDIPF